MFVVLIGVLVVAASAAAGGVKTSIVIGSCPCRGDANATMLACPYPCPRTCSSIHRPLKPCTRACPEFGCECNGGYVLSPRGKCILPKDCPAKCPANAIYKRCPSPCQPTCEYPSGIRPCTRLCIAYGCECKQGYVLSPDGKCIRLNKCPAAKHCSRNETFAPCKVNCPSEFCPVDDGRAQVACAVAYPCPSGCVCKENHRRLSRAKDKCILASDCPQVKCTRPNEEWNSCPPNCLSERCDDIGKVQQECNLPYNCAPQCVCKQGFYRNDSDICVPISDCKKCSPNAVYKKCPFPCPGTCDNPTGVRPCTRACLEYGCECNPGYLLSDGKCIPLSECPAAKYCSRNQTFAPCKVNCPSEFCPVDDRRAQVACSAPYPCPPGCICNANYLRLSRSNDKCVLASDCPPVQCTRPNEEWNPCPPNCLSEKCDDISKTQQDCKFPYYCAPKCVCKQGFYRNDSDICVPAAVCNKCPPNSIYKKCPSPCPGTCDNPTGTRPCPRACLEYGCECKSGYVLSGGKCIPLSECPDKCPPNSVYKKCPSPCPGTCDIPNGVRPCTRACLQYGCECNPGYVLSDGKCILLKDCPAAQLCRQNETFSGCKVECPNKYCPVTDTRSILVCDPPLSCRSGCTCQANYRRFSGTNDMCILASDCPPLNCTRPNEEWNTCPSNCLAERCDDIGKNQTECNLPYSYCDPQCVCKPGFYRNISDICVPVSACRKCTPNATYKKCPSPCPGTCENPSGTRPCTRACIEYGCECNPGFVLSDGKCIRLSQCPAAKYCKTNETFVACKVECPNNYCPEVEPRGIIACDPPYPCPSGCTCKANHRRLSQTDDRCILARDCPPLKCRGPNEEWSRCPSNCLAERCEDVGKTPRECNLPYSYCDPKCVCKRGYYRSGDNICIPASRCRKYDNKKSGC